MPRIIKIRTVTTIDLEYVVGEEYATGPLTAQQRKDLQKQIERQTIEATKHTHGSSVVDVSVKRAFVVNDPASL